MIITRGLGSEWMVTRGYGLKGWSRVRRVMMFKLKAYREMLLSVFLPGEEENEN